MAQFVIMAFGGLAFGKMALNLNTICNFNWFNTKNPLEYFAGLKNLWFSNFKMAAQCKREILICTHVVLFLLNIFM